MTLAIQTPNKMPVQFNIPAAGFAAAYAKMQGQ
jgi:hypothetical protein